MEETILQVIAHFDACLIVSLLGFMAAIVFVGLSNRLFRRSPNHWAKPLVTLLSTMLTGNVLVLLYRYLMRLIWGG